MNLGMASSAILKGFGSIMLARGFGVLISREMQRFEARSRYLTSTRAVAVIGTSSFWSCQSSLRRLLDRLRGVEGAIVRVVMAMARDNEGGGKGVLSHIR